MNQAWESILSSVRGLFGSADVVVAQVFHACYVNLKVRRSAFAFIGKGKVRRNGSIPDGRQFRRLLKEGFFIQAKCPAKKFKKLPEGVHPDAEGYVEVVYVSRDLVRKLIPFLRKQGKEIA